MNTRPELRISLTGMLALMLAMCLALTATYFLAGCEVTPQKPPVVAPAQKSACEQACGHQRELNCELGTPTPGGSTCEDVCEDNAKNGFLWNTRCLAEAKSCDDEC